MTFPGIGLKNNGHKNALFLHGVFTALYFPSIYDTPHIFDATFSLKRTSHPPMSK